MGAEADKTYTVRLTAHTYGGEALGRLPDGRAVFTPYALPGETVRVRLVEEKRGFARAALVEVIEASPERIEPRCFHFGECGGCHYQHMAYPAQLAAKADILRDQLERIGKLSDPPVQPCVPSPQEYNYRNHVQFQLTAEGQLGYHKARSNEAFAIRECHLPEGPLNEVWPRLEMEPNAGVERVSLRLGAGEDILLALEASEPLLPAFSVEELPISVVHIGPEEIQVLAGSDHVIMEVLGRPFRVSAGSFFQVNTAMAEKMVAHLVERLPLERDDTVVDAYAGVGLFSAFLAGRVERLVGVEASASACADYATNLDEFDNVELYQARSEEVLAGLDLAPRVMVVDPPRAGIERRAMDGILALRPDHLAYASCDPATLGRDARRLQAGGYRLVEATPFDLFPQTYHIESISFWVKEA
jgi:23S rRNA (uracil1939-C5)-methyltransferase